MEIKKRKNDHFYVCRENDVEMKKVTTGLEKYEIAFNPLPEVSFKKVKTETHFFGKKLSFPFMIGAMTGGSEQTNDFNLKLAGVATKYNIIFSTGSFKSALVDESMISGFDLKQKYPELILMGNLGLQSLKEFRWETIIRFVKRCNFDFLAFHVNPLHEVFQEKGDTDYSGLINLFLLFKDELDIPCGIKTVGFGGSLLFAESLNRAKPDFVEISGAGGTSFAKVEFLRAENEKRKRFIKPFLEFGIPLERSIQNLRSKNKFITMVASGGIRNGIDIFKALCLGADICAASLPFVKAKSVEEMEEIVELYRFTFKVSMFVTGVLKVEDIFLKRENLLEKVGS